MSPAETLALAERLHAGQVDKSGKPYAGHLRRVVDGVRSSGARDAAQAAAALHDAVEDGHATPQDLAAAGVSADVLELVALLTKAPGQPYADYLDAIKADPDALAVKLADIADNSNPARLAMLAPDVADRLRIKYAKALEILMSNDQPQTAAKKTRGRPKKSADEVASEMIHYRATVAEKAKYLKLGGAKWLAAVLKRARVSPSK